jgi:hypothetical protein
VGARGESGSPLLSLLQRARTQNEITHAPLHATPQHGTWWDVSSATCASPSDDADSLDVA